MKAKISKGAGFRGVVNYLLDKERGEIIGGNMAATTQAGLSAEFGAVRTMRPDIAKPVWHVSLSLPPGDSLSVEQWREVAADFLHKMDVKDNQFCIVQHKDKAHQHIHIVLNRVTTDGGVWYADRDVFRAIEATRQLEAEKDYLRDTADRDNTDKKFRPTKKEEGRKAKGQDIARQQVHDAIRRVIDTAPHKLTTRDFIEKLRAEGIEARPNIASTGRVNGFSFSLGEHKYTGSKVNAKWAQLQQEIDYQPSRDNAYLLELIGRKPQETAFSSAEFEQYRAVLDKYMDNPTIAVDLRDDIKKIGINKLTRGVKELNNEHYQQLAALYDEQKNVWQKIRAQRPPMRLTARDMTAAAVMFALSPALGALVILPYAIDKLIRYNRKAQAADIAKQIYELKAEIVHNNRRRDALNELRAESKQFMEEQRMMKAEERNIIRDNVKNRINTTAEQNKDFSNYIDYVNQSRFKDTQPTYDELASMYEREAWRKNNAVLRGTDTMLAAAVSAANDRPENRALYILPMVFDALSKVEGVDDRIDGQTLDRAIQDFGTQDIASQYVHADMEATKAEEIELIKQTRERTHELTAQIRRIDIAEQPLPAPKINRLTNKVTLTPEEYERMAAVYKQYEILQAAHKQAQYNNYDDAKKIKELEAKNKDLEGRLSDYDRAFVAARDGRNAAENKTVELSEKLEIIEAFLTDKGLNKPLANWIADKAALENQMQDITRSMSDFSGMEM